MKVSLRYGFVLHIYLVVIGAAVLDGRELGAQETGPSKAFYEELQKVGSVERLKSYLDVVDPQKARLIIIRMVGLDKRSALPVLRALWEEGRTSHFTIEHVRTYEHPIVRLTLAEHLMALEPASEYSGYIKQAANHDDWIVQSLTAEALVVVDDSEAVELLAEMAHSEHPFVAERAMASLKIVARNGKHVAEAEQAIRELNRVARRTPQRGENNGSIANPPQISRRSTETDDFCDQGRSLDEKIQPYLAKGRYEDAIDVLMPAASDGNARAQHLIGELYLAVDPPDYERAHKWFAKAVVQDFAPAKTSLANLYLSGRGVKKSEEKAVELLNEAAQQGDQTARMLLERAQRRGWWGM